MLDGSDFMVGIVPRKHPLPSLDDSESTAKVKVPRLHLTVCDPMDYTYSPWNSPGQNSGAGSLSLLQGIFPTQRSNPGLPHCRQILYQLDHKARPRILEWVDYPFSRGLPTQELNRVLLHCRQILYRLSYQRSPGVSIIQHLDDV